MGQQPNTAQKSPLRVGLTGGIASGKSLVAQQFSRLGIPVIDADQVARELTEPGTALFHEIVQRFGALTGERVGVPLVCADGTLNRKALRTLVFQDAELRGQLEALLHPPIRSTMERRGLESDGAYQIYVVPLLVETGGARRYDRILVVDCPEALQLARLQARDGMDSAQARAMLAAQASREARLAIANDVIHNEGPPEAVAPQIAALDQKYRALAHTAQVDRRI
jgi:dephospho-CoA kinase